MAPTRAKRQSHFKLGVANLLIRNQVAKLGRRSEQTVFKSRMVSGCHLIEMGVLRRGGERIKTKLGILSTV